MKISEYEPKKVFEFFEKISSIPHGSGNTARLADWCMDFAQKRGLKAYKDKCGNVMITKPGTAGYENSAPVILQGHLDMVCEKNPGCEIDMENEGIRLCSDGKYIWADGTTLGGDDGIAIAYILDILDSDNIPHPPIEALFTCDEETGLWGALNLDASHITGKRLINIDSEEEGILTVSCAGGTRIKCLLPLSFTENAFSNPCCRSIKISGLLGGHSGMDIGLGRQNAVKLAARVLDALLRSFDMGIISLDGGGRDNVIPRNACVNVCFEKSDEQKFIDIIQNLNEDIQNELKTSEPKVHISTERVEYSGVYTDIKSTRKVIFSLDNAPDGVQRTDPDIPQAVRTSLNLGSARIIGEDLETIFLIRSNIETEKEMIKNKLCGFFQYIGAKTETESEYPGWEYNPVSPLRDTMISIYKEMYGEKPEVMSIHAGLECGILSGKLNGADMVSFGPNLENVHTPDERMEISSVRRCREYLLRVLEALR